MILDSSALVAVIFQEPGYEILLEKMASCSWLGIGAPVLAETAIIVAARLKTDSRPILRSLLSAHEISVIPFTEDHFAAAAEAYLRFGRGRHKAALNFGDCLVYAVAKLAGEPLLFTGADFTLTDIEAA